MRYHQRLLKVVLFIVLFFANVIIAQPILGISTDSLPVKIKPYDPNIQLIGRFDKSDANGPRCAWTGSAVTMRFQGKTIIVLLKENGNPPQPGEQPPQKNYFTVIIDDSVHAVLASQAGAQRYRLALGLKDTVHTLMLFKRTEASVGTVQLLGFELEAKKTLLAPPTLPKRRIEMVGNSITCGYGNEAPNEKTGFTPATENGYLAYGAITARDLKAEYRAISWSGKGMCRNIDLSKTERMPEVFERTLPADTASRWDFSAWVPDVVVINLCTNDFNRGNPTEEEFTGAYRAFIQKLRTRYPQAHIFCAVGSMMGDGWPKGNMALTTVRGYLTRMVESINKAGDPAVYYTEFAPQNDQDGFGANYHPNLKTNRIMAAHLTEAIKKVMGW